MLPAVFGSAVYQFNQFVGTLLASFLARRERLMALLRRQAGSVSLGHFCHCHRHRRTAIVVGNAALKDHGKFQETLDNGLCLVFFIVLPATAGLLILGKPIVVLLFERGAFGAHSSAMTTDALVCYTVGLWAFSGMRVLIAAFYALQDTKTPVKVADHFFGVNVILSLVLMGPLKHAGLALALSLASMVQFGLLALFFEKRGSSKMQG
jgi:putative peptidoglycan lipid II flippase